MPSQRTGRRCGTDVALFPRWGVLLPSPGGESLPTIQGQSQVLSWPRDSPLLCRATMSAVALPGRELVAFPCQPRPGETLHCYALIVLTESDVDLLPATCSKSEQVPKALMLRTDAKLSSVAWRPRCSSSTLSVGGLANSAGRKRTCCATSGRRQLTFIATALTFTVTSSHISRQGSCCVSMMPCWHTFHTRPIWRAAFLITTF